MGPLGGASTAFIPLLNPLAYRGRFAPSPTGPLHAGSLVAALASWLDARAHCGTWLVRIEDVDTPRCVVGADLFILEQLTSMGLVSDEAPLYQSQRSAVYNEALGHFVALGQAYPCTCSRKAILTTNLALGHAPQRHAELIYPGTCRPEHASTEFKPTQPCAWRFRTDRQAVPETAWQDRRLGVQTQNVAESVGDFALRRADGCTTYQLAVVADDAFQGITHVVRGEDLADNTARQILLQRALGLATPIYLHTPLVLGDDGEKLSKQNGAAPLDISHPLPNLKAAAQRLGLNTSALPSISEALSSWVRQWSTLYNLPRD